MLSSHVKRLHLPLFFLLCLLISWAVWVPQALTRLSDPEAPIAGSSPANLLAVWAPAISAVLLLRLMQGRAGPRMLIHPLRNWRVGVQWWLFILLYPVTIWLIARAVDALFGRAVQFSIPILTYFPPDQLYMVPVAIVFAFPNALGEELGWRGFALPALQAKQTALVSSGILGLFWAVWHVPLWIANGMTGFDLLRSATTITSFAVLLTWVYNNTGGGLLLAWLFHASTTITQYFLQTPLTLTDDILKWAVAALLVIVAGPTNLSRTQQRHVLAQELEAG